MQKINNIIKIKKHEKWLLNYPHPPQNIKVRIPSHDLSWRDHSGSNTSGVLLTLAGRYEGGFEKMKFINHRIVSLCLNSGRVVDSSFCNSIQGRVGIVTLLGFL